MAKLPKKFQDRVIAKLKQYQTVAAAQKARDVSEADTVTVVKDILADLFGYDKYAELTSEQQIKGTFCDLAILIDGKIRYLVEVKSAGLELKENHIVQALNYGANQGVEWVVLTNAVDWRVYRVIFGQPVSHEEVASFTLTNVSARNEEDLEHLFILARDGIASDAISDFHQRATILSRFTVAQVLMSEPVVQIVRRELRRMFSDVKIDAEQISNIIEAEVLKREVLDGDRAKSAASRIKKAQSKLARQAAKAAPKSESAIQGE